MGSFLPIMPNLRTKFLTVLLDPDGFALEVADAAYLVAAEQFEAADHDAGEHARQRAGIERGDKLRGIGHAEIDRADADCFRHLRLGRVDIADIGKTVSAQQVLDDELRREAQRRGLGEGDLGDLQRSIGRCQARAQQRTAGRRRNPAQKVSPVHAHAFNSR